MESLHSFDIVQGDPPPKRTPKNVNYSYIGPSNFFTFGRLKLQPMDDLSTKFLIHVILEIPPQIKIRGGGFKSGDCVAHSISHFLLISLSLNRSLSQARESFVVWGMVPILPEPLFISIYTSASSQ